MLRAAQLAIQNGSTTAGGAKSAVQLATHLSKFAEGLDRIKALQQQLGEVATKAKREILPLLEKALKDSKNHIKEIEQKWRVICEMI